MRSVFALRWLLPVVIRLLSRERVFHRAIPTIKWTNHVKCSFQFQQKRKPRQNDYSRLHVEYHLAGLLQGQSIPINTDRISLHMVCFVVGNGVGLLYCSFAPCNHCNRAIYNWLLKVIPKCSRCALLRSVIGLKIKQSDAKPNHSQFGVVRFPALGAGYLRLPRVPIGLLCCLRSLWLVLVTALLLVLSHRIEFFSSCC